MIIDDVMWYMEMCNKENVQTLQRGMNFRINPSYSLILMSRKNNSIYTDKILEDWITIEYEWHDIPKKWDINPKIYNQEEVTEKWTLTQNWKFINSIKKFKLDPNNNIPEIVKVYEKILSWVWSFKWFFELIDYKKIYDWNRYVFRYILKLSETYNDFKEGNIELEHTRLIPSDVKKEVWKRDKWKCVICWSTKNLHFDHDLPFSKWWTSLSITNIKLLCMVCNLKKSDKIE